MNVLAIDTSGFSGSIALIQESEVHEIELTQEEKTAQFLVPKISEVLNSQQLVPADLNLLAVTSGPGSFTGIRIGMTTAKSLAYATECPVVGVNSLAAIAHSARHTEAWTSGSLTVALNAFRKQLFLAHFDFDSFDEQSMKADGITEVVSQDLLLDILEEKNSQIMGTGLDGLAESIKSEVHRRKIPFESAGNCAVGVGELGKRLLEMGLDQDPITLLPNYFRGSAAEEKLSGK